MAEYRIMIVGAGFWGKVWIPTVQETAGVTLAAVVARRPEAHAELAEQFGLDERILYADYHRALAKSGADVVVAVTPAETHVEIVREALAAGKHVICEKPLAESWERGVEVARIVKAHGDLKFMVAQTRRFVPQVETIRGFIAGGKLGKVNFITFDHRVYDTNEGWRRTLRSPVLEDMSAHHFDAFRYMTGEEPVSVFAEGWNPPWSQFPVFGAHNVLLTMTGDIHVNYFGTWTTQGQQNSYDGVMKVVGEKGTLDLVDGETLNFYPAGERAPEENPAPERIPMQAMPRRETAGVLDAFLTALADDVEPPCNIDDNLKTFATACAALESCERDHRVDIPAMLEDVE